jgi:hypothetical protein
VSENGTMGRRVSQKQPAKRKAQPQRLAKALPSCKSVVVKNTVDKISHLQDKPAKRKAKPRNYKKFDRAQRGENEMMDGRVLIDHPSASPTPLYLFGFLAAKLPPHVFGGNFARILNTQLTSLANGMTEEAKWQKNSHLLCSVNFFAILRWRDVCERWDNRRLPSTQVGESRSACAKPALAS